MRLDRKGVVASFVLALAASCNALWGVDDLDFRGAGAQAAAGSGGVAGAGTGGQGGAGGGGGTEGAGACSPEQCVDCSDPVCANDLCGDELAACAESPECAELAWCMQQCAPSAAVCQGECVGDHPDAVRTFYEALQCASCRQGPCRELCDAVCDGGCSVEAVDCGTCLNSLCAQAVCEGPMAACSQIQACQDLGNCIVACGDDPTCEDQCVDDHPSGVEPYDAVLHCTLCTKPACWDVCASEISTCRGFGG